ncbi:unnamed protein product [Peniophora sp. CBMAI 1063]|nr:unnamed protein product [Peniophora sp. CBMAI 1063]
MLRTYTQLARRSAVFAINTRLVPVQRVRMSTVITHSSITKISTSEAPAAIGPYSQAVTLDGLVFVSGCLGFDPKTMNFVEGGVEAQARQALTNLKAVLEAAGSEMGKVAKVTVFMKDMNDFVAVNKIYEAVFGEHKPARSAVEVARLPKDALVEIEAIAKSA